LWHLIDFAVVRAELDLAACVEFDQGLRTGSLVSALLELNIPLSIEFQA
jgi:hypothetical protein